MTASDKFCEKHRNYFLTGCGTCAWEAKREAAGLGADLDARVTALEKLAHPPLDLTLFVAERAEAVARLFEADPHQFSKRPCATCTTISGLLNRAFGCVARGAR